LHFWQRRGREKARAKRGVGGDRATHIVLRLVRGDLDDGVHRITLDVVLLELGFGAEVRDDLRGGGGIRERQHVLDSRTERV